MRIAQEEMFGPVLSVLKWKDVDEAIAIANSIEYGLTAAIWTNDINTAHDSRRAKCSPAISGSTASPATSRACRSAASRIPASAARRASSELLSYTEEKVIHIVL